MSAEEFKPGDWIQSPYGTVGIVATHETGTRRKCKEAKEYVCAVHVYGTSSAKAGSPMHLHRAFAKRVAHGTEQPPECMDPLFWAMMI